MLQKLISHLRRPQFSASQELALPADMEQDAKDAIKKVMKFTMTSVERLYALRKSVEYIVKNEIPGDFVECGVWRGGSSMMAAMTFKEMKSLRDLHLFDTFEGMTAPTINDVSITGQTAEAQLKTESKADPTSVWCVASLDEVKANLASTGYPKDLVHFHKGMVESTIPQNSPSQISILRLDTDWYESTRHELEHLYSRLSVGGVLIIDDYGHWQGARKATDEFFLSKASPILLNRVDYTGRIGIKARN